MANEERVLTFDVYELGIIRELLSIVACAYERDEFFYHCCDANEIIEKIDAFLEIKKIV